MNVRKYVMVLLVRCGNTNKALVFNKDGTATLKPINNFHIQGIKPKSTLSYLDSQTCQSGYMEEFISSLKIGNTGSLTNYKLEKTCIVYSSRNGIKKISPVTNDDDLYRIACHNEENGTIIDNEEVANFIRFFIEKIKNDYDFVSKLNEKYKMNITDHKYQIPKYIIECIYQYHNQITSQNSCNSMDEDLISASTNNEEKILQHLHTYQGFRELFRITRDIEREEKSKDISSSSDIVPDKKTSGSKKNNTIGEQTILPKVKIISSRNVYGGYFKNDKI